jgi:hypothetical protein
VYLILATEKDAKARSAEAWEQRLGRKKRPEDVTEFLWSVDVGKDGRAAIVIAKSEDVATYVKPEENASLEAELPKGKGQNWEKPSPLIETGEIKVRVK